MACGQADPGPRDLEDGPHRDTDRPAVQRVCTPGRDEHGVDAQRGAGAEDGPDIRVVHDVLQDDDPPGTLEQFGDRGQCRPLHRRQRAPVQVESGDSLDDAVLPDEDRDPGLLRVRDDVSEIGQPAHGHEVGPGLVAGSKRPPDHLLRLGDVEAPLGLGTPPQRHVGEADIVGEPLVGGVIDADRHGEKGQGDDRSRDDTGAGEGEPEREDDSHSIRGTTPSW